MRPVLFTVLLLTTGPALAQPTAEVDQKAPEFTVTSAAGDEITFPREQTGVDIYLFWATWCPFCKAFMPHLQSIEEEYGDQVTVFAFQIRDDEDGAVFLERYGFDFELVPDADDLMPLFEVKSTPGLFLVDRYGIVRLNLYALTGLDIPAAENMKRSQIAARAGPWWAAKIRQALDAILAEQ